MERKPYSAGAVKFSFWFMEFRKTVQLLSEGKSFADIKKLNEETNIYGAPTKLRAQQIYSTVTARIKTLDESFYPIFLSSDLATQKLFVLTAALLHDTLFFDFVYEVVREKMILGSDELTDADIRIFFKNKQEQSEKVASLQDYTLHRLGSCYKTQLYEAGILESNQANSTRKILKPILDIAFEHLFYNMGRKTVGLVGLWDCVAFDEVAGIKFKDKDGIQIMKDYMASGSFARGKEEKAASASMVFVGNINQSVDVLLKTSSLFDPFPPEMGTDTAFLDRLHCYIPGWEIPKFRPEHFTNDYGFITDYLAEFIRELRKEQYGDALDKYFRLGKNLNQRDTIAVRKIVGGYVKLLYPDGEFTKEQIEEILVFALEMRRRVKEQLKKLGGMEFYDVNFSYIDLDTFEEKFVSVPEQGGGKLIPDGICNPGQVYTVSQGKSGMIGVFRLESQMLPGNGKFERTGLGSDRDCKESTNTAFNFLKANGNRISGSISTTMRDYIINYQDLQGIGMTGKLALPTLIALCSIALGRPTVSTLAVLGEISISGTILKVDELANSLQVCLDSGAKKVLLPITSAADLGTVPPELVGSFNLIFYSSAEDAVFKALGVE